MSAANNRSFYRHRTVRRAVAIAILAASALLPVSASESTSIVHSTIMRGHVLEADGSDVVICIGSNDGAVVGQELKVIRHTRAKTGPKAIGQFRRSMVGTIRIDEIVDGHYAEATVVSGEAKVLDSVELER
jgi:hypothetical protein